MVSTATKAAPQPLPSPHMHPPLFLFQKPLTTSSGFATMTDTQSDRKYAVKACVACRSKKRRCDKVLPACTRCTRLVQPGYPILPRPVLITFDLSSVYQNCQYDDNKPHSKELPILGMRADLDSKYVSSRILSFGKYRLSHSGLSAQEKLSKLYPSYRPRQNPAYLVQSAG
jgi:hypothetical protein